MRKTPKQRRFVTMVEYSILLVLIAIASIAIFRTFGDRLRSTVSTSADQMQGVEETISTGGSGDDSDF